MRILIVDDESLNRFLLIHMLEEEGYLDCFEARNGDEALALAEQIKPDLILLDVIMPGLSGFDVAPKLKAMNANLYLPIIFITSLDDKESLVKCLEVGGDDFVSKPFDRVILSAKIRAHSRIRQLSSQIEKQNQSLLYHSRLVEREHAIVEHIFNNAIVNQPEVLAFFDTIISPAAVFNGDVFLCEASPAGGAYFLVGDFTGHGLASAIGVLPVSRAFQAMVKKGLAVSEMAVTINETLLSLLPSDMFFAACIVEVDISGTRFTIWNGGMPQVMLKSVRGCRLRYFPSRHMALGILTDSEFDADCDVIEAEPGDQLLFYTDGLMEVMNESGEMADEHGVIDWFTQDDVSTALGMYNCAKQFRGGAEQADDMTIVVFNCQSLESLKHRFSINDLPYTISLSLKGAELRNPRIIDSLMEMLNSQPGVALVRSDLYTIFSEIFNNALEHGVLHLDSSTKNTPEGFIRYYEERERRLNALEDGKIRFDLQFLPTESALLVSVKDSGSGFALNSPEIRDLSNSFGRGIPILRELCDKVEYTERGTRVTVRISMVR